MVQFEGRAQWDADKAENYQGQQESRENTASSPSSPVFLARFRIGSFVQNAPQAQPEFWLYSSTSLMKAVLVDENEWQSGDVSGQQPV